MADSETSAADRDNVVRGLIALGRLSADSNEPMRKVLDAVSLGVEGRTVVMKWSGHVVDVFQAFEQEWMKRNMPR